MRATNRISERYKDEEWLRQSYLIDELSKKDIGDICGVSEETVRYYLKKYDIPTRRGRERATQRVRDRLSATLAGRTPWNAGLAGAYQKWTKRGEEAPGYKGGSALVKFGVLTYRKVLVSDHPNADANGYVFEHRLVCEEVLGRYLLPNEVVHHRDGDSLNNDPKNLFVFSSNSDHITFHRAKDRNPLLTEEEFCNETGREYCTLWSA